MPDSLIYESVFNCSPFSNYLLSPTAEAIVLAVNQTFLVTSSRRREELVGLSLFDAFPGNPSDPEDTGVTALRNSIMRVIATGESDTLLMQRYPIVIVTPEGEERYEERYWNAVNTPIFGADGKLLCISHTTVDVTKQREAELALRASEERFRSLVTATSQVVWLAEPNGAVTSSPTWAAFTGQTCNEAKGYGWLKLLHPDDQERTLQLWKTCVANGITYETEYRVRHISGEYRWMAVHGIPVLDASGAIREWIGASTDITEHKRTEERMRENAERLRLATDAAKLGIWTWDIHRDGGSWENDRMHEIFGTPKSEGMVNMERFIAEFIHPDDREPFQQAFATILDTGARLQYEGRFYRPPNQELRWFELTGLLHRDESGNPQRVVGTAADITERKHIEAERQRFVSLAERSTDFISMVDLNMRPFFINRSGLATVGLDTLEQAWQTPITEFFFPEDREFVANEFFPQTMEKGNGETEIRFRHFKTGKALWMIYSVYVLYDEHGSKIGHAAVSRNITERKRAEEALRQADRRKDEFLAMLAHELRNPLAPISTAAQLLKLVGADEKKVKKYSEVIARQVTHMKELVDDLLDVSRVTRGLVVLDNERLDLKAVVTSAIEQARPLIEARGHVLHTKMSAAHAYVYGDRTRLIQVIVNLLTNAAKYTPRDGEIVIALDVNGSEVKVCVIDNGIGIEPSLLPHVFELFTQAERTPDRSQGGLGLGLALVRSIMAMHYGRVEADSDGPGKGSCFSIILPLVKKESAVLSHQTAEEPPPSSTAKSLHLMVVDDNLDAANTLAAFLEAEGHHVTVKSDPTSALSAAAEDPPEVFILDIGLPEMDGYELARHLRARPETAKASFIALTGYGQAHDKVMAEAAGFDHHFVKPMDTGKLVRLLAR